MAFLQNLGGKVNKVTRKSAKMTNHELARRNNLRLRMSFSIAFFLSCLIFLLIYFKMFRVVEPPPVLPLVSTVSSITHPSDVLDMPVDPNEPTYCLCSQVSYGEMIGCDNTEVLIAISFFFFTYFCTSSNFLLYFLVSN